MSSAFNRLPPSEFWALRGMLVIMKILVITTDHSSVPHLISFPHIWQNFTKRFSCQEISCCSNAGKYGCFRWIKVMPENYGWQWWPQIISASYNSNIWLKKIGAIDGCKFQGNHASFRLGKKLQHLKST